MIIANQGLRLDNRQSLSRDAIMSLLSLANRKGAVTAGELHSHFASQNPDRAGATSSLSYTGTELLRPLA